MAKQQKSKAGNPNLKKGLNPQGFKKGYDPRRNLDGAPPKPTRLQVLEAAFGGPIEPEFERGITEMTPAELRILVKRTDLAAFVILYAKRILKAIDDKDTKAMEEIFDRAYGKPTSRVALTDTEGNDKEGPGIVIYLPDNGREDRDKQNLGSASMDNQEVK
jgi:hypothetical protein